MRLALAVGGNVGWPAANSNGPVLDCQVRHTREIPTISRHEDALVFESNRRNAQVHTTDVQLQGSQGVEAIDFRFGVRQRRPFREVG